MYEVKDKYKRWLDYELDGVPSRMPSVVAEELVNRKSTRLEDDKIVCESMVFSASDFQES